MFEPEDMYDPMDGFTPSWSTQLDIMGMQPHSREHLEYEVNCARSERKFQMIEGELMDYVEGVQFTGRP